MLHHTGTGRNQPSYNITWQHLVLLVGIGLKWSGLFRLKSIPKMYTGHLITDAFALQSAKSCVPIFFLIGSILYIERRNPWYCNWKVWLHYLLGFPAHSMLKAYYYTIIGHIQNTITAWNFIFSTSWSKSTLIYSPIPNLSK